MRLSRAGVPRYHAYGKTDSRPEYRGAYATEGEAFAATKMTREELAAVAEKSLLANKGTVDRRRKFPKSLTQYTKRLVEAGGIEPATRYGYRVKRPSVKPPLTASLGPFVQ